MALKQCDQCSEMVEEAKAFCPGCGNSLVIETKRKVASNFESFEGTINLGDTMFNQMLSDMGLNISKAPDTPDNRVEVLVAEPAPVRPAENVAAKPKLSSTAKWLIAGAIVLIILTFLVILAAAVVIFMFRPR